MIRTFFEKMSSSHILPKTRRKIPEVPVHNNRCDETRTHKKTFSANFNSRGDRKNLEFYERRRLSPEKIIEENEPTEDDSPTTKVSRKSLKKEIERLGSENNQLLDRLSHMENSFSRKATKMKEKIVALHSYNGQMVNENETMKVQYEELLVAAQDLKNQLDLSKHCKTCEELREDLQKSNLEYTELRKTNKELLEDLNMLKNVVYRKMRKQVKLFLEIHKLKQRVKNRLCTLAFSRLNFQMEGYQEKLRKQNVKPQTATITVSSMGLPENLSRLDNLCGESVLPDQHHSDHAHTPISWGKVNAHTLGPLLDSYQETIAEKEDIINSYEGEFANFTGKLKDVIAENEALHKRLTEDERCSTKLLEELEIVRKELKTTKDQNDLLIKKCALKQDKAEEILKCYEKKVGQMQIDYKLLHEEYFKCRGEMGILQEKNKALAMSKEEFKNERDQYIPVAVHAATVNECKRLYEELKSQYEYEKDKLRETIVEKTKEINELNNRIGVINSEKEELENKVKSLEKHIKKSEAKYLDLQHTLNEVQLSRSACRKQLHKAMSFAKELVNEQECLLKALNERKQENKVVKKLGSDIATRMDSLRNQLKTVQRDAWQELETVEVRLQEKDSLITSMKDEYEQEIERLKSVIEEHGRNDLLLENSSIPVPHYLLFRDRNMNK